MAAKIKINETGDCIYTEQDAIELLYSNPELDPDSGDIVYIENRKPIQRASDQTEDIKLIIEF